MKQERERLFGFYGSDPRVQKLMEQIRAERAPRIAELDKLIAAAEKAQPAKKPRWPEGTPAYVLAACDRYWRGTTEHATYRIHCWNSSLICTSYPSGGYSDNGGWHLTPACFHFIRANPSKPGALYRHESYGNDLTGRQSQKQLDLALAERTRQFIAAGSV